MGIERKNKFQKYFGIASLRFANGKNDKKKNQCCLCLQFKKRIEISNESKRQQSKIIEKKKQCYMEFLI